MRIGVSVCLSVELYQNVLGKRGHLPYRHEIARVFDVGLH